MTEIERKLYGIKILMHFQTTGNFYKQDGERT